MKVQTSLYVCTLSWRTPWPVFPSFCACGFFKSQQRGQDRKESGGPHYSTLEIWDAGNFFNRDNLWLCGPSWADEEVCAVASDQASRDLSHPLLVHLVQAGQQRVPRQRHTFKIYLKMISMAILVWVTPWNKDCTDLLTYFALKHSLSYLPPPPPP